MPGNIYLVLYVLALIAVIVGVDLLLLRHQFWARLIVNISIVLVFAAFCTTAFMSTPPRSPTATMRLRLTELLRLVPRPSQEPPP